MTSRLYNSLFLFKRKTKNGKKPIYLRITIDGKRQLVHTGVFVSEKKWDPIRKEIIAQEEEDFANNNLLRALQTRVTEIYTDLVKQKQPSSSHIIRHILRSVERESATLIELIAEHNNYVKKRVGIDVAAATKTKYECLKTKVKNYLRKEYSTNDMALSQLNRAFLIRFEFYLKADAHIGHNTAIKYIQFLKRVINYGIEMEWIQYDPFKAYKCTIKPVIREFLTQEEIDIIESKELPQHGLANVRNLFVFSCYTGLAYADVRKLKWHEITKGIDGKLWIQTYRAKTTTRVPIPLLPQALGILLHSSSPYSANEKVFNVPSNQKVNEHLKDIARLCDISKKLTFHIARHTFATTVTLTNGVPIETVSKMLGHTNIKTTQIYSKVVDFKISEDMSRLAEKIMVRQEG